METGRENGERVTHQAAAQSLLSSTTGTAVEHRAQHYNHLIADSTALQVRRTWSVKSVPWFWPLLLTFGDQCIVAHVVNLCYCRDGVSVSKVATLCFVPVPGRGVLDLWPRMALYSSSSGSSTAVGSRDGTTRGACAPTVSWRHRSRVGVPWSTTKVFLINTHKRKEATRVRQRLGWWR